jgi:ribosomal protein L11 methyltransferase
LNYIKVNITLEPLQPAREVLYADLDIIGFESIVDTETGVEAYMPEDQFFEIALEDMMVKDMPDQKVDIVIETIEKQNWNATWESHFEIIEINDKCSIRAPFHESTNKAFDIVISPQMSFGTGHHETTFLMSKHLFLNDLKGKSLLDMGCGTAVLAIIAHKLGAIDIVAIDIEDWAYQNSIDNCKLNQINDISIELGDARLLVNRKFDIILANINRNILLQDLQTYADCLTPNGQIFLSGFYDTDVDVLKETATNCGLTFVLSESKNNWTLLHFKQN